MIERHLARLRARHPLSDAEEEAVRGLVEETRVVGPRTTIIREGERLAHSTLLLDGLLCRYKDLRDGKRQITELNVPGDFADMHSFTLKTLDHSMATLTESVVGLAPHDRIRDAIERHPRLGRLYWFGTNLDAAIHREWEVSLGQRSATARAAALFCEMHLRLGLVGLAEPGGFALPITQNELGECLGLTPVHVNRILRQLREDGLVSFRSGRVEFGDLARLRTCADFSDDYLYLEPDDI